MGTLYLVATPIGNLEDITARAMRVLAEVSLIAAEDTRHTKKLLSHLGIQNQLTSYFEHNKLKKLKTILDALMVGDVALVSDAGTPALNDPGYTLVRTVLEAGHQVSPIPGPSAPLAALVASGLPTDRFFYLGYLPRKSKERRQQLESIKNLEPTLICLEGPHRLTDSLQDLSAVLGDRRIAVARELTKLHEDIFRGTISEASTHYDQNPPRGEITLVIAGSSKESGQWHQEQVEAAIREALAQGGTPSTIAKAVASKSGWPRRELYDLVTRIQKRSRSD
jgi:16S rRNA (cytidine1402-2'-O)-methyltransferase